MRRGFFEDPACRGLSRGTRKTRKMSKDKAQTEKWRPRSPVKDGEKWLDRCPDLGKQELAAHMRHIRVLSLAEKPGSWATFGFPENWRNSVGITNPILRTR